MSDKVRHEKKSVLEVTVKYHITIDGNDSRSAYEARDALYNDTSLPTNVAIIDKSDVVKRVNAD